MGKEPSELDEAIFAWKSFKDKEEEARKDKWRAEERILKLMGEESKATTNFYKLSIQRGEDRKITDFEGLAASCQQYGANWVYKMKPELDGRRFTALREAMPDLYKDLAQFIEVRPKKPALTVEEVRE